MQQLQPELAQNDRDRGEQKAELSVNSTWRGGPWHRNGEACSVWLLVHNMVVVLLQRIVWSRRHRLIRMLAAVMLARLQMQEIVFAGRRGVNKYMQDEARREGLLSRMPVAEIGRNTTTIFKSQISSR